MKQNRNQNRKPQNTKSQQARRAVVEAIPFMAEINVPAEKDFVKIPVSEFMGLVANSALLDAVKRYVVNDTYNYYADLRTMLGVTEKKEEK